MRRKIAWIASGIVSLATLAVCAYYFVNHVGEEMYKQFQESEEHTRLHGVLTEEYYRNNQFTRP